MAMKTVQFLAIVLVAVALVPAGAHLLELVNKIGMARNEYLTAQQIYRGWALLGIVLIGAIAATFVLALFSRPQRTAFRFAAAAFLLLLATLVTFFVWIFPANQATANWTTAPENWQALRTRWEYTHAANAVLTLAAFVSTVVSALAWSRQ